MASVSDPMTTFVSKISDKSLDYQTRHSLFSELRDTLETYHGANEYTDFLKQTLEIFFDQLDSVPISFVSNSPEQKLRYLILEIIHRLPINETLEPYASRILDKLCQIISDDNEENGIICLKFITSLHKAYKSKLIDKVPDFVELLKTIYKNMPEVVEEQFGENSSSNTDAAKDKEPIGPTSPGSNSQDSDLSSHDDPSKTLFKATKSFKMAAECPITLVSLYSSYKSTIESTIPEFVPLVINMLRLQAAKQKEAHDSASAKGEYVTHVSYEIYNRPVYGDFVLAQVKAASFLAYVFIRRSAVHTMEPFQNEIPDLIVRLLQDCPSEMANARRELLHATRHILSTDYRKLFLPKIEMLFDDLVLIGDGLTAHETLRPLAYSIVADFIHVNSELTPKQIWQSVVKYCGYLQDNTLAPTVHIMSAKLLLNLLERILKLEDHADARQLFLIMIDSFGKRFASLNREYDDIIVKHKKFIQERTKNREHVKDLQTEAKRLTEEDKTKVVDSKEAKPSDEMDEDEDHPLNNISSSHASSSAFPIIVTQQNQQDPLDGARYLFRTLMTFLKSICYGFRNCNPVAPKEYNTQSWNEWARITSAEELNVFRRLFRECISGLRFFQSFKPMVISPAMRQTFDVTGPNLPITSSKEEKDLMEIFATIFIYLEPSAFNEIVKSEQEITFQATLDNPALLHIPQFFLANEITTSNFSGVLIVFVISKLRELGEMDILKSNILIRLFKLCFMSVNLFPTANENVILPHLNELILKCLEYSTTAKEPIVYFYLIRTLFRSIGGGRFEALYKEILPLLHVLLESLNRLIQCARRPYERDIYVELCLTVPVRLSVLVPYLGYLMRPLVCALNGPQELVSQGLRTLELCVDNLTAEYFDPIIEPVVEDVAKALWKHLKPLPYYHQHSHTTLRILGKLGGRNRNFLKLFHDMEGETLCDQSLEAFFKLEVSPKEVPVSITAALSTAFNTLENVRYKLHYRVSAFHYLSSLLKLMMNTTSLPKDFDKQVQQVVDFVNNDAKESVDHKTIRLKADVDRDPIRFNKQEQLFLRLLKAVFYSTSIEEVREEAQALINGISRHCVLLYLGRSMIEFHKYNRQFSVNNHEGHNYINENTVFEAISYALSFYNNDVRKSGKEAISSIYDTCAELAGSPKNAIKFLPIRRMCSKFIHCCFEEKFYDKLGGCIGLQVMINELDIPQEYLVLRQLEIVRAIFFVLRDNPPDMPSAVCTVAQDIVLKLLKDCNREVPKEAVFQQPFQSIVSQIVFDLSNSNLIVRKTAQKALQVLSEVTTVPISTLISPSKGILLAPIFGKPLRALPFHMQIGNIDAITFCLGLDNTFLEFNDELNRLLSEALALVDADDESLISVHRISEHRTAEQLVTLRVVCIQLLSLALTKPEFSNGNPQIRIRILSVFFKALCANSTKIIDAAHAGLKKVLSQNSKLPKELLQSGLRPMLMNLSDHKKLTVTGLEALSRLLELLISYFKVEIGRKLLDHLMAWAQPQALQRIALQNPDSDQTVQIIVAILKIFYLLPPQAFQFMDEILTTLLYLESNLRRHGNSPFREPIAKYLDRFADYAAGFFQKRFASRAYGSRFAYFVSIPECGKLRSLIEEKMTEITQSACDETNNDLKYIKLSNLVDLSTAIASQDENWLKENLDLIQKMIKLSIECLRYRETSALASPIHMQLDQANESLQALCVHYLKATESVPEDTIKLIDYVCQNKIPMSFCIDDFVKECVVQASDVKLRQQYLCEIATFVSDSEHCLNTKIYLIKNVYIPVCHYNSTLVNSKELTEFDDESSSWVKALAEKVWEQLTDTSKMHESYLVDEYRVQLLQLTSLIVQQYPEAVTDFRKVIIKFDWNLIGLEDMVAKQAAYTSTAYFIAAFDTPAKVATQIFMALLKTNQLDIRFMVRQALDILAPCLKDRLRSATDWLKWPRRVLSEDGFNVTQVLNVYQFIVHHSELFYIARDQFVPNIITAMGKLTVLNNSSTENQALAIELAELILNWETRERMEEKEKEKTKAEEQPDDPDAMDVDVEEEKEAESKNSESPAKSSISGADSTLIKQEESSKAITEKATSILATVYTVPLSQRETCITFLVRYVCICQQRASENELGQRALNILHILLSPAYWPEVTVKLTFFERFLISADFNANNVLGYCLNALEVLCVALEWKKSEWIMSNLGYLQRLLEKCIKSDNHDIQESLQKVLKIILSAIKQESPQAEEEQTEEAKAFVSFLVSAISDDLNSMNSFAAGITLSWTLAQYKPEVLDPLIALMLRTLSKLVKDHITIANQSRQRMSKEAGANGEYEAKMTTKLLEKILDFASIRIGALGDQRRIFLSLMVQLIDRSVDKDLLMKIAAIVRDWVFAENELFPTTKEKAGILTKMMVYELKGDSELTKTYYQIIVDIFKDEKLAYSELTFRLERPFLVGTKISDVDIRRELMSILDKSLEKDIVKRLFYVVREQNWEYLAEYPWLNQASQLLYKSFDFQCKVQLCPNENQTASLANIAEALPEKKDKRDAQPQIISLLDKHRTFINNTLNVKACDVLNPLLDLSYQSPETIHKSWCILFPIAYNAIENRDKSDFLHALVTLLSKDYHVRQQEGKPNVVTTLLAAAGQCPDLQLPPHLVKYLGINYGAWYSGIRILEQIEQDPVTDNPKITETNRDALAEMYSNLQENDMFYGLWRRRAKYYETNAALSYEQIGLWDKASRLYETAQIKARSGVLPFSEAEYSLWEDDWILCSEKLQHWDILTELAKHEGFTDLLLECGWRVADWIADREPLEQSVKTVMDVPTPRRQMFQTFLCLQGYANNQETIQNVTRNCDEGIQLSLRKWYSLPSRITDAHVGLLHMFQQYVEFMEASQVYRSLATTTAQNLDVKSQELKRVLQAWRERLPNVWDDINIWNDLVTWRQHAFNVINKVYMPLLPALQQNGNSNSNNNSYAFRGYHEIAWVINRFAHVARKHNMPEVCINQLTKIYTLPNIEIQEAFLKLREQAKCHYENQAELNTGLDVISNTNLVYFAAQQKAEFITLKGMFLAKLSAPEEANQAFATAVQLDLNLPKAWAEWGFFNDNRFKSTGDIAYAKHAISCYLQAAGLYKSNKARRLLCRILWLVSLDDASGTLTTTFESHQGEMPVWQWVTFIPQLLTSLSHREARVGRHVLIRIAKSYPQALHFQLRTTKEDYAILQRQMQKTSTGSSSNSTADSSVGIANVDGNVNSINAGSNNGSNSDNNDDEKSNTDDKTPGNGESTDHATSANANETAAAANPDEIKANATSGDNSNTSGSVTGSISGKAVDNTVADETTDTNANANTSVAANAGTATSPGDGSTTTTVLKPWQYIDEIMGILKTAYPLLALSLESLVDQISQRFKSSHDGDAYRLVVALYNDGIQYFNRLPNPREDARLPPATEANILRFADTVLPRHIRQEFETDIIQSKPNLETYISKLRKWRDCLEEKLDRNSGKINLERVCPHLSQFHHQKFEDIEVPGQYLLNTENNRHFIKIERFMPTLELIRGPSACYKRLTIRGHDGSLHPFAVQFPAARHCRREERMFQLFRLFNDELARSVETRKRYIDLTLPVAIPLSPHIRLMSDNEKYIDMSAIYEEYCRRKGQNRDEPLAYTMQKLHTAYDPRLPKPDILSVKTEILAAIQSLLVPNTVMKNYFLHYYPRFEDFWVFRKQFSSQYAAFIFMTYMLCINSRQPQKIHIHQGSGRVWTSEMLPYKVACGKTHTNLFANSSLDPAAQKAAPIFCSLELVPFRLTPNVQKLIGEAGMEGILSMHLMAIAQCLANPAYKIEHFLDLFIRDEVIAWFTQRHKPSTQDPQLREIVKVNVDYIIKRIYQMAHVDSSGQQVASQYVLNLIGHAVNPRNLASTDTLWMAYF
ncbi:hypothetical protein FOA43_001826 [Brettanomyces nanus]|uniref:Non-specific serine/threonine protein kinase n=1 Tax=Eeniella nana TaxID=13502 RepID=A0A875RZA6_EENNA|nr:uncharacterized protein FOA43_001826 [Brettanomyces nanus]QPG74496.1 hypothetical protein FOA43_001826 [Brettanomyces nanus]